MLKVALPNKGQLGQPAAAMLAEAGYAQPRDPRDLMVSDVDNHVDFFRLRPKDIATYVAAGTLDLGITGWDMVRNSGAKVDVLLELGFAPSRFFLAAPAGKFSTREDFQGSRIATSYPGLLREFLLETGLQAEVIELNGAVENAIRLGVADAIADVVDTGTTLRQAGLATVGEPILESQAVLIAGPNSENRDRDVFLRRLQGVLTARNYVLVDYDIPVAALERACALTPGLESPTISSLQDENWLAVRAVVPKSEVHKIMDELADLGGKGILVTAITACRT